MPNYQVSRAVRETYNAKLTRLDYEERTGKLLNAEDVAKEAFAVARRVRDRLLNIPSRMASVLASETDSKTIEALLSQELRIALEELVQ
jgi:phage terminase Nu1 subunit (DNA packaging protein)